MNVSVGSGRLLSTRNKVTRTHGVSIDRFKNQQYKCCSLRRYYALKEVNPCLALPSSTASLSPSLIKSTMSTTAFNNEHDTSTIMTASACRNQPMSCRMLLTLRLTLPFQWLLSSFKYLRCRRRKPRRRMSCCRRSRSHRQISINLSGIAKWSTASDSPSSFDEDTNLYRSSPAIRGYVQVSQYSCSQIFCCKGFMLPLLSI